MSSFGIDFWCNEAKQKCPKMFAEDYDPEVCKNCELIK